MPKWLKSLAIYYILEYNSQELYILLNLEITVKKFSALLICLLMLITCSFAGCATFSVNKVKYYNEVLATVDETKITRFDLLSAYNSYGNSYFVQQQGQSEQEALNSTLDLLIDRELMYQYAKDNEVLYRPTAYQINEVIIEMFSSLDSQMDNYVKSAKTILNIEEKEDVETEETSNETAYTLDSYHYSPRAFVKYNEETGKYYIEYNYDAVAEPETYDCILGELNRTYLTNFTNSNILNVLKTEYFKQYEEKLNIEEGKNTTQILNKARSLFATDLINYEFYLRDANGKAYDKTTENLFTRYFERTYHNSIKSQYLENVRTHYLKNEELKISLIESNFKDLMDLNYSAYNDNHSAYKSKMKDIGTNADDVLYHPNTDSQFGYFVHTLISFDSIKSQLSSLDEYKGEDKDEKRADFIKTVSIKPRNAETGLVDEDAVAVNIADILKEYEDIRTATYDKQEDKLAAFINFMFKYTGDTATLSAGMPYVVGTNGNSAMEQAFTDEAVYLMENGSAGNMSVANINNIDDMCVTSYGIHLLYYVGDVNSFDINYADIDNVYIQNDDIENLEHLNLYNKIINPLTKETYFDMMFDIVYPADTDEVYSSNNGYSEFEENITALSQASHPVVKYVTKIKGTKLDI